MYKIEHPKIHMAEVANYDVKAKVYNVKNEKTFEDEKELIEFLAKYNRPIYNFDGNPIKGRFKNKYLDNQALDGISRSGIFADDKVLYDFCFYPYQFSSDACYRCINREWKINNYIFWLDVPGQPNLDVRVFKRKVDEEYLRQCKLDKDWYRKIDFVFRPKQGRKHHKHWPSRNNARYIQRARSTYAMEVEEEYKEFVKIKDKEYKRLWLDGAFSCRGGSTGWKDNSGNRYRHQWEPKTKRKFESEKQRKEIAMYSGNDNLGFRVHKKTKHKEELEAEVEVMRKTFRI